MAWIKRWPASSSRAARRRGSARTRRCRSSQRRDDGAPRLLQLARRARPRAHRLRRRCASSSRGAVRRDRAATRAVARAARRVRRCRRHQLVPGRPRGAGSSLLHGLGARRHRAVLSQRRARDQRRRRAHASARLAGAAPRSLRRRPLSDRVAVGARRERRLADVVRLGHRLGRDAATGPRHRYHIKYAESPDGLRWDAHGRRLPRLRVRPTNTRSAVRASSATAIAIACGTRRAARAIASATPNRPTASLDPARRSTAWSPPSDDGWDAEMVTYPVVFGRRGRGMLYNGNGYGRTGIGLAAEAS